MRLSTWRAAAPAPDAVGPKVSAALDGVMATLGAGDDPHVWIAWGEDPANRYTVLVPTDGGLVVVHVRVNVPGEGPRAGAKLTRWSKLVVGELSVEVLGGRRHANFQVEAQILNGVDAVADDIARFALVLFAGIDGRPWPSLEDAGAAT
jgi:hypothetical protein